MVGPDFRETCGSRAPKSSGRNLYCNRPRWHQGDHSHRRADGVLVLTWRDWAVNVPRAVLEAGLPWWRVKL